MRFEIDPADIEQYQNISIHFAAGDNSKLLHELKTLGISIKEFECGVILNTSKLFSLTNYPCILLVKFYQLLYRKFQFHDRECVQVPNCSNFAIGTFKRYPLTSSLIKIKNRVKICSRLNSYVYFN